MQLERSYFRRVKVLGPFIYENCPSSRRAYFSIRLAVKTSRPQYLKELFAFKRKLYATKVIKLFAFPNANWQHRLYLI